nr:hypothetical protein BaRGS_005844 [Batillaria attramentaria]
MVRVPGGQEYAGWFHAVRALEAICLALLIIACIYALASNCCRAFPGPRTRVLEILSSIGGVLGLVGVIVYGAMRNDSNRSYVIIEMTIDWALYLTGVGSGLAVVAAVIIGITNKEISQPTTGAVIGMTTVTSTAQHTAGQPAYPAHQPGYPAPQPGYPAHQPGYPAHYGDYPGSGGGYPPPQAGYGYPGKY